MKICKVEIIKKISGGDTQCHNVYPTGYDAEVMNVICNHDTDFADGDIVSYVIATVSDDFVFTDKMVEITKKEAEVCIDDVSEYYREVMLAKTGDATEADAIKVKYADNRKRYLV